MISQKTSKNWRRICFLKYFVNYVIVPSIGEFVATKMSLWLATCDKATYNWPWLNTGSFNSTVFRLAPCALFIVQSCTNWKLYSALSVFNRWPCPWRYRPITIPLLAPLPQRGSPFLKKIRCTEASHCFLLLSVFSSSVPEAFQSLRTLKNALGALGTVCKRTL